MKSVQKMELKNVLIGENRTIFNFSFFADEKLRNSETETPLFFTFPTYYIVTVNVVNIFL